MADEDRRLSITADSNMLFRRSGESGVSGLDKTAAINIAKKFASAIRSKYNFNRMFIFGSYIKGNYHDESDIDIAVVFDDFDNTLDMQLELMRLRRKIDSRIEPHPFRERDFTNSNPLAYEILKYGKELEI